MPCPEFSSGSNPQAFLNGNDHLKAEVFGDDVKRHANCCAD